MQFYKKHLSPIKTGLDPKKNVYGTKLNVLHSDSMEIVKESSQILESLTISRDFMTKKDVWKIFLSTLLLELDNAPMKIGTSDDDLIVYGFKNVPRLIVEIDENGSAVSTIKLQNKMANVLISNYNDNIHWHLPVIIKHLCVYGIIVCGNEFRIYRMSLNAQKGTKLSLLFTGGKQKLPYNLFTYKKQPVKSKINVSNNKESCLEFFEEWSDLSKSSDLCDLFEELDIIEDAPLSKSAASTVDTEKIVYKRPNKGSVAAIVGLMQTLLEQDHLVKMKNKKFKNRRGIKFG